MELYERMKEIQTDSDQKVKALAAVFRVTPQAMGNYLNGVRTVPYEVLTEFADYFHVTTDYLFGLTDDPKPPYPVSTGERAMLEDFRTLTRDQKELIVKNIALMREQNRR